MAAPPKGSRLTRERVVQAAVEVLDEVGLENWTMRLVARRLGVQLNTVYWHTSSKPELLELMCDYLLAGCADPPLPELWHERVRVLANRYRDALLAHRDGALVVAGSYPVKANTLAVAEAFLAAYTAAGFSDRTASWATWHTSYLIVGSALDQQAAPEVLLHRLREGADPDRYPHLHRALRHQTSKESEERFTFSIDLLLDGLHARLAKDGQGPATG